MADIKQMKATKCNRLDYKKKLIEDEIVLFIMIFVFAFVLFLNN